MKKCIILVGISGSGKTTTRNEIKNDSSFIISKDDIRSELVGNPEGNLWDAYRFVDHETRVLDIYSRRIDESLNHDHVIIDNTNLNPSATYQLKERYEHNNFQVDIHMCSSFNLSQCMYNNKKRTNALDNSVINDQYLKFLQNYYVPNQLPRKKAIICDVDGTLAHMYSRSPYDWDSVDNDTLDPIVSKIVKHFHNDGYKILVLSGRNSVCYEKTEKWLTDNDIPFTILLQRPKNDHRADVILKEEIYDTCIKDYYDVQLVLDDRPVVVDMWNDLGLKVLACADQRIKF